MRFGLCGNPSVHFQKIVKFGEAFAVTPGPTRAIVRKFYPKKACTGRWISRGLVSFKSVRLFLVCTGLQVSRRPVSFQLVSTLQGGYRSTGFAWTGPCRFSEGFLGGYRSSGFAWTGPSTVRNMFWERYRSTEKVETGPYQVRDLIRRRVPVYAKRGDRSLCLFREKLGFH